MFYLTLKISDELLQRVNRNYVEPCEIRLSAKIYKAVSTSPLDELSYENLYKEQSDIWTRK